MLVALDMRVVVAAYSHPIIFIFFPRDSPGKYVPKYIESLLRKYIVEYVTCQMCRSPNTTLTRDPVSRLFFVHCQVSIFVDMVAMAEAYVILWWCARLP